MNNFGVYFSPVFPPNIVYPKKGMTGWTGLVGVWDERGVSNFIKRSEASDKRSRVPCVTSRQTQYKVHSRGRFDVRLKQWIALTVPVLKRNSSVSCRCFVFCFFLVVMSMLVFLFLVLL